MKVAEVINQMFTPTEVLDFLLDIDGFLKNVWTRNLWANWLTLQIYCDAHNYANVLNYADVFRQEQLDTTQNEQRQIIILDSAFNCPYGTISEDVSII